MIQRGFKKGLGDKTADTCFTGLCFKFTPVVGGNQQNRHIITQITPDFFCNLDTIHAGQFPIQQDDLIIIPLFVALVYQFNGLFPA